MLNSAGDSLWVVFLEPYALSEVRDAARLAQYTTLGVLAVGDLPLASALEEEPLELVELVTFARLKSCAPCHASRRGTRGSKRSTPRARSTR